MKDMKVCQSKKEADMLLIVEHLRKPPFIVSGSCDAHGCWRYTPPNHVRCVYVVADRAHEYASHETP